MIGSKEKLKNRCSVSSGCVESGCKKGNGFERGKTRILQWERLFAMQIGSGISTFEMRFYDKSYK